MQQRVYNFIAICFMVVWVLFIFLDYLQKHPTHYFAFERFHYLDLTAVLAVLGGLVTFIVYQKKSGKNNFLPKINGLSIFALSMLIISASLWAYQRKIINDPIHILKPGSVPKVPIENFGEFLTVLGSVGITCAFTYLIIVICFSVGELSTVLFESFMKRSGQAIVNIAAGIMILVMLLFFWGLFGLLKFYVVFLMMLFLLALNWRGAWRFVRNTLIDPIEIPKELNWMGIISFFILLCIISFNAVSIVSPFPLGFDSLTLYLNLPGLIRDYSGLVEGFQPYNWALFMSLGHILFDKPEVVMALSSLGGILCLFAMYELGRNWFEINVNYLLLALLIFYLTPSIIHQSVDELKVDLALLFFSLIIVNLFVEWINRLDTESSPDSPISGMFYFTGDQVQNGSLLVLAGLLTGFAIGIKLTALFIVFGLIVSLWYALNGTKSFVGIGLLIIGFVFFVKMDDISGLRQYHYTVDTLKWLIALAGLLIMAYVYKKSDHQILRSFKLSLLFGLIMLLSFSPWIAKNYYETSSFSPQVLMNGKPSGPKMNMKIIQKNWELSKQKNDKKGPKKNKAARNKNNKNKN